MTSKGSKEKKKCPPLHVQFWVIFKRFLYLLFSVLTRVLLPFSLAVSPIGRSESRTKRFNLQPRKIGLPLPQVREQRDGGREESSIEIGTLPVLFFSVSAS